MKSTKTSVVHHINILSSFMAKPTVDTMTFLGSLFQVMIKGSMEAYQCYSWGPTLSIYGLRKGRQGWEVELITVLDITSAHSWFVVLWPLLASRGLGSSFLCVHKGKKNYILVNTNCVYRFGHRVVLHILVVCVNCMKASTWSKLWTLWLAHHLIRSGR